MWKNKSNLLTLSLIIIISLSTGYIIAQSNINQYKTEITELKNSNQEQEDTLKTYQTSIIQLQNNLTEKNIQISNLETVMTTKNNIIQTRARSIELDEIRLKFYSAIYGRYPDGISIKSLRNHYVETAKEAGAFHQSLDYLEDWGLILGKAGRTIYVLTDYGKYYYETNILQN